MKTKYLAMCVALALGSTARADTTFDYSEDHTGNIEERIQYAEQDDGGKVTMNITSNVTFDGNVQPDVNNAISLTQVVLETDESSTPGLTTMNISSTDIVLNNINGRGILVNNEDGGGSVLNITDSTFSINNINTTDNSYATGIYVIEGAEDTQTQGVAEIHINNDSANASDITIADSGQGIWVQSNNDNAVVDINSPGLRINVGNANSIKSTGGKAEVYYDPWEQRGAGNVKVNILANIYTQGQDTTGIYGVTADGHTDITSSGVVSVQGPSATGIQAEASDRVTVSTLDLQLTASGEGARGIVSNNTGSNGDTFITLGDNTQASGGWGADATGVSATSQKAVTMSIDDTATLGAMNDSAMVITAPTVTVTNKGTLTGNLTLSGDDVTLNNSGTLHLRNWQDTDGDGTRDTKAVAVSSFGGNGTFNNTGTIVLGSVANSDVTSTNTSKEYATGYSVNSTSNDGIMQAQLLGLSTFSNSGTIDMSANGKVGDTLVLSSSTDAGVAGNSTYVSNGGTITMDVVLNEGGANSQSDMLIVDNVEMGSAKTDLLFTNTGTDSDAALTTGGGIKVVDMRGSTSEDAFELAGQTHTMSAGQYIYRLE